MSRFIMGLKILLVVILCSAGLKVEAHPLDRCLEVLDAEETLNSIMTLPAEERLNAVCPSIKTFFKCLSDVGKEQFGYDLKDLARLLEGTDIGKTIQLIVNSIDVIEEICTEGSQLRKDVLMDSQCVQGLNYTDIVQHCDNEASSASAIYRLIRSEYPMFGVYSQTRQCVITVYKVGCLGAKMYEECGERAFNTYKEVLRRTGFFKLKICSPNIIHTLKTRVLNILEDLESRRSVYRKIFDMKKKRK